jgi:hypothetical protein
MPQVSLRFLEFTTHTNVVIASVEYDPMFQLIRPMNLYVRAHKRVKWPPKGDKAS